MIEKKLQEYIDSQIKKHGYLFFPNGFPFTNLTHSELEEVIDYLATKKITRFDIGSKVAWNITKIPDNIGNIKSLTSLTISSKTINHIPDTIGELSKLEMLSFNKSKITKIPSSIKKLTNLKKLQLANIKIDTLPNIQDLINLESLIINDTKINHIPDYLCELKFLNLIDVRNVEVTYFPACLIDKGTKIKTNDVVNLGVSNFDGNSYKVFIQIRDEFKIIIKEYLSYFNQFVKRKKGEVIKFNIDEIKDGLMLNFKVHDDKELDNVKDDLSEFISFTEKSEEEIIPHISEGTSKYDMTMLMLELKDKIRNYHGMIESTKDRLKVVHATLDMPYDELDYCSASSMIAGFQKLSEATPISNIYLAQNQNQEQHQEQHQMQELKNHLSPLSKDLDQLISMIKVPELKEDGNKLLNDIYPIMTKPTEDKIEESGLLPKLSNYMEKVKTTMSIIDDGKEVYNKLVENYNGIAKIMKYSLLALL